MAPLRNTILQLIWWNVGSGKIDALGRKLRDARFAAGGRVLERPGRIPRMKAPEPVRIPDCQGAREQILAFRSTERCYSIPSSFSAAYSGPSSLQSHAEIAATWVATIYTGYALSRNTEFFFDIESARGAGVSGALGLGGLGNLDAVTDRTATAAPYIARAQIRQIVPLSKQMVPSTPNPLGLAPNVPARRLEFRIGKMSLTDFFDLNAVGSDSHLQFLNHSIDNNAAYDIAANSRGYTYAALAELYDPAWTLRFAEAVEPRDTSGLRSDFNLSRSRSENLEFEIHPSFGDRQLFTLRALAFLNHAEMGSYPAAVSAFRSGKDPRPDLAAHIAPGSNYGFGLNGETVIRESIRLFSRLGWNQGTKEIFQFAESDRTLAAGGDVDGRKWHRRTHRVGIALAVNGLAAAHRQYLELGGLSYLLGDDGLDYGREKILEGYYNLPLTHGIFAAFDVQHVWNPGYNRNRARHYLRHSPARRSRSKFQLTASYASVIEIFQRTTMALLNSEVLHLHTYFLFPFSIDQNAVMEEHPEIWRGQESWFEKLDLWVTQHVVEECQPAANQLRRWQRHAENCLDIYSSTYQDMMFFHPFVRKAFFDTGNSNRDHEALVHRYVIRAEPGARLFYEAEDGGGESAKVEVTELKLLMFANRIGILTIGVEARGITYPKALWINEMMRKIYPSSVRQIEMARIPNRLALVQEA